MLGNAQKGGITAAMQSTTMRNESCGVVGHNDMSKATGEVGWLA